jgi:hypothetical protein
MANFMAREFACAPAAVQGASPHPPQFIFFLYSAVRMRKKRWSTFVVTLVKLSELPAAIFVPSGVH